MKKSEFLNNSLQNKISINFTPFGNHNHIVRTKKFKFILLLHPLL